MHRKQFEQTILALFIVIIGIAASGIVTKAYQHGYKRKTDEIYALVRQEISVYASEDETDYMDDLGEFTPIVVTGQNGSWIEITYKKKGKSRTGYITEDDFYWGALRYDGREKQPVADGTYIMRPLSGDSDSFLTIQDSPKLRVSLHFLSDGRYRICLDGTNAWLQGTHKEGFASWESREEAGHFHLIRDGDGYVILEDTTKDLLTVGVGGALQFSDSSRTLWRMVRQGNAVTDESMRDFVQFDGEWASHYYGQERKKTSTENNFTTSGCGIFATMNAIYAATGQYADPYELADYAVDHYYRIDGAGTDSGFFKAAASAFGDKYGFSWKGQGETLKGLKKRLQKGQIAIAYVPGHYVAIIKYSKKTKRFLVLDPHYLKKRKTSSFGDWVPQKDLEEGNLYAQMFYYYQSTGR